MSKKIIAVSSSIYNLIGKQEPVKCIRVITMDYLFNDADRFTPVLTQSLLEGNGLRFRNFLKWAALYGYNDWLGIKSPKFLKSVTIDDQIYKEFFHKKMEDKYGEPEQTRTFPETVTVKYPNPEYIPDPETGEYPEDIEPYITEEREIQWEEKAQVSEDLFGISYYGYYKFEGIAPVLLDMFFAGTINELKTNGYYLLNNDDSTLAAVQIERERKEQSTDEYGRPVTVTIKEYYLRFGDLTTYYNSDTSGQFVDFTDDSLWDYILGDINITPLVQSDKTFVCGCMQRTIVWQKAIYQIETDEEGNIIYPLESKDSTPTIIGWEDSWADKTEDLNQDINLAENTTWDNFADMGPLTISKFEDDIYTFRQGYIITLPTGDESLDNLFPEANVIEDDYWGSWFPMRWNNHSINEQDDPEVWEWGKKYTWRLYKDKGKVAELIESVNSNSQIGDIDYCYLEIGIPLNVKQDYVCRYMLEFWKAMGNRLGAETGDEVFLSLDVETSRAVNAASYSWSWGNTSPQPFLGVSAFSDNASSTYWTKLNWGGDEVIQESSGIFHKYYGNEEVSNLGTPYKISNGVCIDLTKMQNAFVTAGSTINISTNNAFNRDIDIEHGSIFYQSGEGLAEPGRKPGECWATQQTETFKALYFFTNTAYGSYWQQSTMSIYLGQVSINWFVYYRQIDSTSWESVKVAYINQYNTIYGGRSDDNYGRDEWNKPEEDAEYSGVLIPLTYNTMKAISLLDATDCTQFASSLRFNCYVVKKKKWYQSGFFGGLIKIAGIVISVVVAIVATPAGGAVVGTGVAGLMGVTSAVATAVINAVANAVIAVVVTSVVSPVLKDLFGDIIGGILTSIISIAVTWGINYGISNGFDFNSLANEFMKIDNILAITKSIGNAYLEVIQGKMEDLQSEINNYQNRYNEASDQLSSATEANLSGFGMNNYWQQFMYQNNALTSVIESRDRFLDRTLMLADDAINIQMQWIEDLVEMTIKSDPTTSIIS